MNDSDHAAARTFHSRLVHLLSVEFASLGAFLEALAEFDRRKLFRDLGHANLFAYLHKGLRFSAARPTTAAPPPGSSSGSPRSWSRSGRALASPPWRSWPRW